MFGHQRKSDCAKMRDLFSPYLDDRLEPVDRDKVRYHAEICQECQRELKSLRLMRELLRLMPVEAVPRSFTLAEAPARRSWFRFDLPIISLESSMRLAGAVAVIAFALLVSIDFTGVLSEQSTQPEGIVSQPPEATADVVAITPTPEVEPTPVATINEGSGMPEALPPDPNSDSEFGIANKGVPETQADDSGSDILDNSELADPNGESGVSSPTPRSTTPFWLLPLEIAAGIMAFIFGSTNLLIWQRKRANR